MIFSGLACGLFYKAMPDWDKMATETPAPVMGTSAAVPAARGATPPMVRDLASKMKTTPF